ncbi:hypothetical protein HQ529_05225 [Candidatus Woesearchaeota archaeon]|nr:hypothetical protein [Candidatus Woesearchaeota archaeon]
MKNYQISEETDLDVVNLALDTIKKEKQALVFVNTKRSAEKEAETISFKTEINDKRLEKISEDVLKVLSRPTKQCERLARCIKKGTAFHHAGLAPKQRELVEDAFRDRLVKIICCTPTLAVGVDLPAFRTILRDLKRFGTHGLNWIPVLEYLQQSGRAGRPKFDKYSESITIAKTKGDKDIIHKIYINGEPEDIYSKLAVEPVLRTYLLSLIATDFVNSRKQIVEFFSKTFWAYQYKDMHQLEIIIDKMLNLLEEWEFIKSSREEFVSADEVEDTNLKPTLLGKRVAELYLDPLTASYFIKCLRRAGNDVVKDFPLLQMVCHTLEMRPLLRTRVKEYAKVEEMLTTYDTYMLDKEPSMYETGYEAFFDSAKTALFMNDWVDERDEEYLMEEYNIRPGEIKAKLDIADWLFYCTEEISKLQQFHEIIKHIKKMRARLKYGAREELLPLLRLKNIGRIRARKLFGNKIKTIGDVSKSDLTKLIQILGKATALNLKKQVGQEVKEVKKNKRKGQKNIEDY